MSKENDESSTKIKCGEQDNFSSVATSEKDKTNISSNEDNIKMSSKSDNDKGCKGDPPNISSSPISTNEMREEDKVSPSDQKIETETVSLSLTHKKAQKETAVDDEAKSHESSAASNSESKSSTTESSYTTSESSDNITASSSDCLNHDEAEESILKMIRHIEKEIESEGHIDSGTESHFEIIERKIKTSRVLVAIEQTIQKLEIAFCLPYIFVENMHDIQLLCGDSSVSKLMNGYCKIRDSEETDICRYQPAVINCINDAFEAGFGQFVALHRKKVQFEQIVSLIKKF